jgi:hypothetical protein
LETSGAFGAVAVGDYSGSALVRARQDTATRAEPLPGFQQVADMLRGVDYDAVLLGDPDGLVAAVTIAAARGKAVVLLADAVRGADLEAAADTATTHGVPLTLLQPARHDAGMDDLRRLVASDPAWTPHHLDATVEAPNEASRLAAVAVSHLVDLAAHDARASQGGVHANTRVRGDAWADPARVVDATILAHGRRYTLHARHAPDTFVRVTGDATAGAFELRIQDGDAFLTITGAASPGRIGTEQRRYRVEPRDHWAVEAARAAAGADDTARARAEGALRDAMERSIATGEEQASACCRRPALRLLGGVRPPEAITPARTAGPSAGEPSRRGPTAAPPGTRRRHLHLVGS